MFSENQRRKHEQIGVFILPGVWRETGLQANLLKKGVAIPTLLYRHLRKQHSLAIAFLDEETVAPYLNLF